MVSSQAGTPGRLGLSPSPATVSCAASHGPAASLGLSALICKLGTAALPCFRSVCRLSEIKEMIQPQAGPGTVGTGSELRLLGASGILKPGHRRPGLLSGPRHLRPLWQEHLELPQPEAASVYLSPRPEAQAQCRSVCVFGDCEKTCLSLWGLPSLPGLTKQHELAVLATAGGTFNSARSCYCQTEQLLLSRLFWFYSSLWEPGIKGKHQLCLLITDSTETGRRLGLDILSRGPRTLSSAAL